MDFICQKFNLGQLVDPKYIFNYKMRLVIIMYFMMKIVLISSLPSIDRVCNPRNNNLPYDGYRGEFRVSGLKNLRFHLYMCKDSRLIQDVEVDVANELQQIPWTRNITGGTENSDVNPLSFVLARRKKYALRRIPLYLPETAIGSLFKGDGSVLPIISEDVFKGHWIEYIQLQIVLHIPIFYTPDMTSNRHPKNNDLRITLGSKANAAIPFKVLKDESYQYGNIDVNRLNAHVERYLESTLKLGKFSLIELFKALARPGSYSMLLHQVEIFYNIIES